MADEGVDALFVAACVGAFLVRLKVLLAESGPVGSDQGNFLTIGHALFGRRLHGGGTSYPPLVPLLVVAAQKLGDVAITFPVLSAAAGVLPALGVYLAFRHLPNRFAVAAAAAVLLMAGSVSEAVAWGGTPQLIGLGALPPALVGISRIARGDEQMDLWLPSASLFVLFAASHFVGIFFALAVIPLLVGLLWSRPGRPKALKRLVIVAAPSLVLVPVYLVLARNLSVANPAAADIAPRPLPVRIGYVLRDNTALWLALLVVAGLCLVLSAGAWRRAELQSVLSLGVIALLLNVLAAEPRYAYLVPTAVVMAIGAAVGTAVLPRRGWGHLALSGSLLAVAITGWASGTRYLPQQVAYYGDWHSPKASGLTALRWLRTSTPKDSLVAVPSINSAPIGWWVEGYGERRALVESDASLLNFVDERRRAEAASSIFRPNLVSDASMAQAQRLGVSYLVIFRRSDGFDAQQMKAYVDTHPTSLAFETQDVVILAVPPATP